MSTSDLTLLVLSDLHYHRLFGSSNSSTCRGEMSRTLLKKVFLRLRHMGVKPDCTVVLGDFVHEDDAMAGLDLLTLHGELTRSGIPFLSVRGNHDGDPERFHSRMGTTPDVTIVNGFGLVVMDDEYAENAHEVNRPASSFKKLERVRKEHPDLPLIMLQHPPIYPPIDSNYPYRPMNATAIMDSYRKAGVLLSLSGHFHHGQQARLHEGVLYHTVRALCKEPYPFTIVRIHDGKIDIQEYALALATPGLMDTHCHTEHAYCGTTVDTAEAIMLSRAMGVSTLCLTEHSFQLYFEKKRAMGFQWQQDVTMVEEAWKDPNRGRMAAYRKFAEGVRSPFVKLGLEVDLYGEEGELLIAPEDLDFGWDVIVGAVHSVRGYQPGVTSQEEAEELFMRDVAALVGQDIQTLAHPLRFFDRQHLKRPTHLYEEIAKLLSDNAVAVEVNFHTYHPDVELIRQCVRHDVPISLASDTHDLAEAGEFWPHLQLLREAGVPLKPSSDYYFQLRERKG